MSLVVNGTTIPTNVAGALKVNGVSVTSVMCNGTNAWLQSLVTPFNGVWSNSSLVTVYPNVIAASIGLQTSGANWRYQHYILASGGFVSEWSGPWRTVTSSSLGGNSISSAYGGIYSDASGWNISWMTPTTSPYSSNITQWCLYDKNTKTWSGSSSSFYTYNGYFGSWSGTNSFDANGGFITSGGLIRFGQGGTNNAQWASLT